MGFGRSRRHNAMLWEPRYGRPSPIKGVQQRAAYGVESGPWIGRVPAGWIATELARVGDGKDGQNAGLFGREGSLLVYPTAVVWLDHSQLGSIQVGSTRDLLDFSVHEYNPFGSRFERRTLVRVQMGVFGFDMGRKGSARIKDAIHNARTLVGDASIEQEDNEYAHLGLSLLFPQLTGISDWRSRLIRRPFGAIRGFLSDDPLKGGITVAEVQLTQTGLGLYDAQGNVLGIAAWGDVTEIERSDDAVSLSFGFTRLVLHSEKNDGLENFIKKKMAELRP